MLRLECFANSSLRLPAGHFRYFCPVGPNIAVVKLSRYDTELKSLVLIKAASESKLNDSDQAYGMICQGVSGMFMTDETTQISKDT